MTWGCKVNPDSKIYVAGHRGLVGSALLRQLSAQGFTNIIAASHSQLDLTWESAVNEFLNRARPEYVFIAAARVGGVCSNDNHEADFLRDNLKIQTNLIAGAHRVGVKKLLFLGSACVYPRNAPEPVNESDLLSGPLEPSNQWYALAKIAGLKLCQAYRRQYGCDFISCMPTNLYGPGDKYDLQSSHVLPALIRKFAEAKMRNASSVTCWGSGHPRREFIFADDLANACILLMEKYSDESPVNIGTGSDMTIRELAESIAEVVGYRGNIVWDSTKPDGTPRRLLDNSKMAALGWKPTMDFRDGLRRTYADFVYQNLLSLADKVYDSYR